MYVFVVPGAVIWYFRSSYIVGRQEKLSENIAIFVLFSALYTLTVGTIFLYLPTIPDKRLLSVVWLGYVAVIPIAIGMFLGIGARQKWFVRLLSHVGLKPKVSDPTGWDWIFSRLSGPVFDESGRWKQRAERQAILISGKRIRHIEIWRAPTTGAANG